MGTFEAEGEMGFAELVYQLLALVQGGHVVSYININVIMEMG